MEVKQSTSVEALCKGIPAPLAAYVSYCRSLDFQERPDYTFLKNLLKDFLKEEGLAYDNAHSGRD